MPIIVTRYGVGPSRRPPQDTLMVNIDDESTNVRLTIEYQGQGQIDGWLEVWARGALVSPTMPVQVVGSIVAEIPPTPLGNVPLQLLHDGAVVFSRNLLFVPRGQFRP